MKYVANENGNASQKSYPHATINTECCDARSRSEPHFSIFFSKLSLHKGWSVHSSYWGQRSGGWRVKLVACAAGSPVGCGQAVHAGDSTQPSPGGADVNSFQAAHRLML